MLIQHCTLSCTLGYRSLTVYHTAVIHHETKLPREIIMEGERIFKATLRKEEESSWSPPKYEKGRRSGQDPHIAGCNSEQPRHFRAGLIGPPPPYPLTVAPLVLWVPSTSCRVHGRFLLWVPIRWSRVIVPPLCVSFFIASTSFRPVPRFRVRFRTCLFSSCFCLLVRFPTVLYISRFLFVVNCFGVPSRSLYPGATLSIPYSLCPPVQQTMGRTGNHRVWFVFYVD